MRQRHLTPLLATVALCGLLAAATPASAGHVGVSIGATFPVGPGMVSLVFAQPSYGYGGYGGYAHGYGSHAPCGGYGGSLGYAPYGYAPYGGCGTYPVGYAWEARPFYYRLVGPLHYPHYGHSSNCYTHGGYSYHHPACPSLHTYFDGYGVHPSRYWPVQQGWSPNWVSYGWRTPTYTQGYTTRQNRYGYGRDDRRDDDHGRYTRRYNGRRSVSGRTYSGDRRSRN